MDVIRVFPSCIVKVFEFSGEIFFRGECDNAVDIKWSVEISFDEVETCVHKGLDPFDVSIVYS